MLVGYARARGAEQSLERQLKALSEAGCAKMFPEQQCGHSMGVENVLRRALDFVHSGDTLVVTRLEHLGPTPSDIQSVMARIMDSGAHLRCLQQS